MPNLIILAGLPGSGKSTWARSFFDLKYAIVSSDEIRQRLAGSLREAHDANVKPWDLFYDEIEEKLRHDIDVIADATFLTPKHRERARAVGAATGASTHIVIFKNSWEARNRNAARPGDTRVPSEVFEQMIGLYIDTLARLPQEDYKTVTAIARFC